MALAVTAAVAISAVRARAKSEEKSLGVVTRQSVCSVVQRRKQYPPGKELLLPLACYHGHLAVVRA